MLVGIGGVAALMMAFEEVDEIERMKTFGLAATIGILFWIASVWIVTVPLLRSSYVSCAVVTQPLRG
jgi:hypothetical protein